MKTEFGSHSLELETTSRILETRKWFERHIDTIHPHLLEHRKKAVESALKTTLFRQEELGSLDINNRLLEEMPVCGLWSYLPFIPHPIPSGFELVKGSIKIESKGFWNNQNKGRFDHAYLKDPKYDLIVDHCLSQFILGRHGKGNRLQHIRSALPTAFHTFTTSDGNELSILIATHLQIFGKLGIQYLDVRRRTE